MKTIDLNADVGEGFEFDNELLEVVTSANICCGTHAGSRELTATTVARCKALSVPFGAHPGTEDRSSMGRSPVSITDHMATSKLCESLREQVERLANLGASTLKLHGTLYNQTAYDYQFMETIADCLRDFRLPLLGLPGTLHEAMAEMLKVPLVSEGFADRAMNLDGTLVPRGYEGSLLTSEAAVVANSVSLASKVTTICLHGDTPGCVELATSVKTALESNGFRVKAWG